MGTLPNFDEAKQYFEDRLNEHGATPRGVDWNSQTAQETRFAQLIKVIQPENPYSLLDYGCGYGALLNYLISQNRAPEHYFGYDILESMAEKGRELHSDQPQFVFFSDLAALAPVDYAIASGIFNLKLEVPNEDWTRYVVGELHKINNLAQKGFSFNMLTKYSDPEYMRSYLYYADPCYLFDYCKTHFSRNIALLHDYEVYDFTIIVRK